MDVERRGCGPWFRLSEALTLTVSADNQFNLTKFNSNCAELLFLHIKSRQFLPITLKQPPASH